MKQFVAWMFVGLCAFAPMASSQEKVSKYTTPFYPLEKGSKWVYRQDTHRVSVTVIDHNVITLKEPILGAKETDKITQVVAAEMKIVNGDRSLIEKVAVLPDGVYRVAASGQDLAPPVCFLKLRKVGETWKCVSKAEGVTVKGTFKSAKDDVKVPAGAFSAIRVSCVDLQIGDQKMTVHYWFAQGVGMVKQQVVMNPGQGNERNIVLELESVKLTEQPE